LKTLNINIIEKDDLKYLLSKGGVSFLFRIIGMILSFFNIWLVSNFFSTEAYGVFSLIQTVILILSVIFTLGAQNVLIIEINNQFNDGVNHSRSLLLKISKLILLVSILPMLMLYFGKETLSDLFNNKNLTNHFEFIAISIPFLLLHEIILYYYIALKKFVRFGFFMFFLPNILFTASILIFKSFITDSFYITVLFCLSYAVTFFIEFALAFKNFKFNTSNEKLLSYKKIILNGLPMLFNGIMILLLNWTDVLMLGIMKSEKEVGIYNAAFKIGFMVLIIISTINIIIVPKISELFQEGKLIELKKLLNRSTQLITILTTPIVLFLIIFGKDILAQFGSDFIEGYIVLVIITLSSYFSSICGNVDQILNFTNNQSALLKINIFSLALNLLLNFFLIGDYGILGAAIASLISTIFLNTFCVFYIKRKLGFYTLF